MQATSRAARRAVRSSDRPVLDSVCFSCRLTLRQQTRSAATAAAPAPSPASSTITPTAAPKAQQAYRVFTSVVVSRPPLLTRPLTSFEKAYHLYNRRLNERLALPFTRYFYYKKGTPQDGEWKRKVRARLTASRDVGVYSGYGPEAWNDEVLVGSEVGSWEHTVAEVVRDAEEFREENVRQNKLESEVKQAEEGEQAAATAEPVLAEADDYLQAASTVKKEAVQWPVARESEADKANDTKSLSRRMDRTLYLLVKNAQGRWVFPADLIRGKEGLHQAAERILVQAGGINMNTWVVGNVPIGHYNYDFPKAVTAPETGAAELGEKVFFMKARIMTGQADIAKNVLGDTDFCWLAKEEIEAKVGARYWSAVKNMLVER